MFNFILIGIAAFIILWIVFVNVMWLKHNKEKVPKVLHKPLYVVAFLGIVYDVLFNFTFGNILFMQLASFERLTLTERMEHILLTDDSWRFYLAKWICRVLVEPWDPNHCGLSDIK